ncbi:MAG: hypothetical protein MUF27_16970 [Acidobacteria bacterium]|jgi:hypothetical protein|nr:hypothetical protein [Acidobacteriota bacterium]
MKPGILFAFAFMVLIAVAHILRLAFRISIAIGGIEIPMWPSILAVPFFAGVAFLIWRESRPGGCRAP